MQKPYLGQAIKYPLNLIAGSPELAYDDVLIQQAIKILLDTPVGTRFFLREYGSRCRELLFETNDEVLEDLLSYFIGEAIGFWEKRVQYERTEFTRSDEEPDRLDCKIYYRNLKTNEINSFVYPFYKNLKY